MPSGHHASQMLTHGNCAAALARLSHETVLAILPKNEGQRRCGAVLAAHSRSIVKRSRGSKAALVAAIAMRAGAALERSYGQASAPSCRALAARANPLTGPFAVKDDTAPEAMPQLRLSAMLRGVGFFFCWDVASRDISHWYSSRRSQKCSCSSAGRSSEPAFPALSQGQRLRCGRAPEILVTTATVQEVPSMQAITAAASWCLVRPRPRNAPYDHFPALASEIVSRHKAAEIQREYPRRPRRDARKFD